MYYGENNILISLNFKCPMARKWIKETITGFKISSFEKINHQIVKYTMYLSLSGIIWVLSWVYRGPKFPSLCDFNLRSLSLRSLRTCLRKCLINNFLQEKSTIIFTIEFFSGITKAGWSKRVGQSCDEVKSLKIGFYANFGKIKKVTYEMMPCYPIKGFDMMKSPLGSPNV